jgi:hypothetical protein
VLALPKSGLGRGAGPGAATGPENVQKEDLASVRALLQQLESEVKQLRGQLASLKAQQGEASKTESAALHKELEATKAELIAFSSQLGKDAAPTNSPIPVPQGSIADRIARLEESQQLADQKVAEQSQTKVESSSKYRLRLSRIVLRNTYVNRGSVENQDFPHIATARVALSSDGAFGGSLRQSQIGLQGFGPAVAGARRSAEVRFDFAGGFPDAPNGTSFGIMRLRTGTVRFGQDTSLIADQDSLFLAPLSPTSIATLAIPAFAYSGNLWSGTPQVRIGRRFALGENSSMLLQGGLLDSLSGDTPPSSYYRYPTMGENSGQPAYATRLAWTQAVRGRKVTEGAGGYYDRQDWGYGRSIDGWAATADLTLPFGRPF